MIPKTWKNGNSLSTLKTSQLLSVVCKLSSKIVTNNFRRIGLKPASEKSDVSKEVLNYGSHTDSKLGYRESQ